MSVHDDAAALTGEMTRTRHAIRFTASPRSACDCPAPRKGCSTNPTGYRWKSPTGQRMTPVTAVLNGGEPGPVVPLRTDMDAPPITKRSGVDCGTFNHSAEAIFDDAVLPEGATL